MHLPATALPGAPALFADPAGQAIAARAFAPRNADVWEQPLATFTEPVRAPTLLNSWADFGSGYAASGFWRDDHGVVHLRGMVKNGSGLNTAIFTLPVGYRPATREVFVVSSNDAFGSIQINTTGDVILVDGSTVWASLSGIHFRLT